jgi:hypothetical protein
MRKCGDCTACCTWLIGNSYGHEFGNGKSCRFLCEEGCSVHKLRPNLCENYFCAWAQQLLPEEMRPDKCNFLVSVENNTNGQYLRVSPINGYEINTDILSWFKEWSTRMNTPVICKKENEWIQI